MAEDWRRRARPLRVTRCVVAEAVSSVGSVAVLAGLFVFAGCGPTAAPLAPSANPAPVVAVSRPMLPAFTEEASEPRLPARAAAPGVPPTAAMGWCMRSRMCELEGLCTPSEGDLCIASADSDCEGSKACLGGRCSARGGVCVAANDEDCRESWACKGYGRCNFDGTDACMATSDADCRASTRCQRERECRLADGVCSK